MKRNILHSYFILPLLFPPIVVYGIFCTKEVCGMAIEFRCSQCGRLLRTGDEPAGRMAQCPECGSQTPIPFPAEVPTITPVAVEPPVATTSGESPFGAGSAEETGENPYQSPQQAWPAAAGYPPSPSYAINRVAGPAVGLIVTGGLGLLIHLLSILVSMLIPLGAPGRNPNAQPMIFMQPPFGGIGFIIAQHALGVGLAILVLAGGMKMRKLESFGLAMAASIIAIVPCFSPCCLLGIPFGIWALVVLNDPFVKSSFK
jgi:hypothetical protein